MPDVTQMSVVIGISCTQCVPNVMSLYKSKFLQYLRVSMKSRVIGETGEDWDIFTFAAIALNLLETAFLILHEEGLL